ASRVAAACTQINGNNLPWVRCNLTAASAYYGTCCTSLYCTGMCPQATTNTTPPGNSPYNTSLQVDSGQTFLLFLMNHWQNNIGFTIDFNAFGQSPINYGTPSVMFWTGTVSNDWFNPANWGSCGPPTCNESAIIFSGAANYPEIQNGQLANCKSLDIKTGASVTLNGTAELDICGNFVNNGSLFAAPTSTVKLVNSASQYFDGIMVGSSKFGILQMNKTLNNLTILDNAQIGGTLSLPSSGWGGKIITGPKELYITNGASGASTFGDPTSFVQGYLRRNLSGAAGGPYYFPVGEQTKGWQLAQIDFTGSHSIPNILSYFTSWTPPGTATGLVDGVCGVNYSTTPAFYDNGYWTLTASANASSANYDLQLRNGTVTNGPGNAFTVMKATTAAGSWSLDGTCSGVAYPFAKRTGMTGFSVFATGQAGALPITLLSFDAVVKGTSVLTTWVTSSEINNDYFVIERSMDGVNFEEVGTRRGAGNSSTTLYYSMLDLKPLKGISYYRLRQVDYDGTESKSQLVAVSFLSDGILNVFPNPTEAEIQYRFNSAVDGLVTFELKDMLGKVIMSKVVSVKKGLNTSEPLDIHLLPHGVYIVQLKPSGSEIEPMQKRFLKQTKEE
ncbi:MAG: T9SS type A sorting domain-containing protein, partial [Bacteroidia bacterium]|nr:T9SS type A sorting domain-containing protein [Bacteroidia bacterium]